MTFSFAVTLRFVFIQEYLTKLEIVVEEFSELWAYHQIKMIF